MPFTVAHAALALPLRRTGLVISAFVVGAMAPDFEYFLWLKPESRFTHHFPGVLLVTLPAALAVLWLFHNVLKRPLAGLLPARLQARLQPHLGSFSFAGTSRFALVALSALAGIASHLLWDSFTHSETWAYFAFPALQGYHDVPLWGHRPLYKTLQHASSVVGLTALGVWFTVWATQPPRAAAPPMLAPGTRAAVVLSIVAVAAGAGLLRGLLAMDYSGRGPLRFFVWSGVSAMAFFFWACLAYALLWRRFPRLRPPDTP